MALRRFISNSIKAIFI